MSSSSAGSVEKADLRGDYGNVLLLFLLYTLQGIPMGLAGSVPFLLQESGASLTEQSLFSLVSWPFSLKVLWAPIVDACFSRKIGRRKSWLLPVQLATGVIMAFLGSHVDTMLNPPPVDGQSVPDVKGLTAVFLLLFFLMATQDIAVDGWALTMLQKRNVGYASTCNSVGQTLGYFISYTGFLCMYSYRLITLGQFMLFWGVVFLLTVALIVPKRERSAKDVPDLVDAYKEVFEVIQLPSVLRLVIILFTCKIGFAAADGVTALKLMEAGVSKEHLALLSAIVTPIDILLTASIAKYTAGPRPLDIFLKAFVARIPISLFGSFMVYWASTFMDDNKSESSNGLMLFYAILFLATLGHGVVSVAMFVSQMSFFNRIARCEPGIGGTYMTLLNTFANLGSKWPITTVLLLVDYATEKTCIVDGNGGSVDPVFVEGIKYEACSYWSGTAGKNACKAANGTCEIDGVDGYYLMSILCTAAGLSWFFLMKKTATKLQDLSDQDWMVTKYGAHSEDEKAKLKDFAA